MRMIPKISLDTAAYIYGLIDPDTNNIRYVGQTVNLELRIKQHSKCSERRDAPNSPRNRWLMSLWKRGLVPHLVVLEECLLGVAHEKERFWYNKLKAEGADLLNGNNPTMTGVAALLHKRKKQKEGTYIYESWEENEHARLHKLQPPQCGCKNWTASPTRGEEEEEPLTLKPNGGAYFVLQADGGNRPAVLLLCVGGNMLLQYTDTPSRERVSVQRHEAQERVKKADDL